MTVAESKIQEVSGKGKVSVDRNHGSMQSGDHFNTNWALMDHRRLSPPLTSPQGHPLMIIVNVERRLYRRERSL